MISGQAFKNNLGWRWSLYLTTIIKAFLFLFMLPFLPEHLYIRTNNGTDAKNNSPDTCELERNLHPIRYNLTRDPFKRIGPPATLRGFLRPFKMRRRTPHSI